MHQQCSPLNMAVIIAYHYLLSSIMGFVMYVFVFPMHICTYPHKKLAQRCTLFYIAKYSNICVHFLMQFIQFQHSRYDDICTCICLTTQGLSRFLYVIHSDIGQIPRAYVLLTDTCKQKTMNSHVGLVDSTQLQIPAGSVVTRPLDRLELLISLQQCECHYLQVLQFTQ